MSGTLRQPRSCCTSASVSRWNTNVVSIFSQGVDNPHRTAGTWEQGPWQANTWVEFDLPHDLFAYSWVHVHCCLSETYLLESFDGEIILECHFPGHSSTQLEFICRADWPQATMREYFINNYAWITTSSI